MNFPPHYFYKFWYGGSAFGGQLVSEIYGNLLHEICRNLLF